jgi:hypothetical protein
MSDEGEEKYEYEHLDEFMKEIAHLTEEEEDRGRSKSKEKKKSP